MSYVLVTGGAGYIGSHTCVELLASGQNVLVLDNLSNSSIASLERVAGIVNVELSILNYGGSPRFARDDEENAICDDEVKQSKDCHGAVAPHDDGHLVIANEVKQSKDRHGAVAPRDDGHLVIANEVKQSKDRHGAVAPRDDSQQGHCEHSEAISRNGSKLIFVEGDIRDRDLLRSVFAQFEIDSVIHFAGLKAVGESVEKPLMYYDNNVSGTVSLLEVMAEKDCKNIVFSSSATVYGDPASVPISEDFPLSTTNPYGASKLMVENIMRDLSVSDDSWSIALLRYFNPVGAHESGLIGEDPNGIPNNLMPFVAQVAVGKREKLSVFGGDYPTHDGTGVRDYIHVVDLAKGHLKALDALKKQSGVVTVNLGTGQGYSVLDMVKAFEQASGNAVPFEIVARRPGDVAQCYADPANALAVLGWKAELGIERMCEDAWRWQSMNPNGYR